MLLPLLGSICFLEGAEAWPLPCVTRNLKSRIRALGRETGEGPSAVIARAIAAESERARMKKERTVEERLARMKAYRATLPKLTEEEKKAVWEEADRMFDYLYEDEQRD